MLLHLSIQLAHQLYNFPLHPHLLPFSIHALSQSLQPYDALGVFVRHVRDRHGRHHFQ